MLGEAVIRYLDGDYKILTPGAYVTCAVTKVRIPLEDLRYWNVDLQEAYADANAAFRRFNELKSGTAAPAP
ncbi:MAG: DUF2093 domain-containing protein [Alphaproteobacteria bacterium]|nr:DUF2093 domain-containing protein [Alphaproteobacteria bacterium]